MTKLLVITLLSITLVVGCNENAVETAEVEQPSDLNTELKKAADGIVYNFVNPHQERVSQSLTLTNSEAYLSSTPYQQINMLLAASGKPSISEKDFSEVYTKLKRTVSSRKGEPSQVMQYRIELLSYRGSQNFKNIESAFALYVTKSSLSYREKEFLLTYSAFLAAIDKPRSERTSPTLRFNDYVSCVNEGLDAYWEYGIYLKDDDQKWALWMLKNCYSLFPPN